MPVRGEQVGAKLRFSKGELIDIVGGQLGAYLVDGRDYVLEFDVSVRVFRVCVVDEGYDD